MNTPKAHIIACKHGSETPELVASGAGETLESFRADFSVLTHPAYAWAQLWIAGQHPKTRKFTKPTEPKKAK